MITKTAYLEDRRVDIKEEGPAIFGQTIVNRLLRANMEENGQISIKKLNTLGKVIDVVKEDKLKNIRSLFKKHRIEIVCYLEQIGVLEYLGIDKNQKERLCEIGWTTKNSQKDDSQQNNLQP